MKRRKRPPFPIIAVPVVALILVIGCVALMGVSGDSREQAAVTRWLDENEGDPDLEIIAWDGPIDYKGKRYILVKYRSASILGGKSVQSKAFSVQGGTASPAVAVGAHWDRITKDHP